MGQPIIGISSNISVDKGGEFPGYKHSYVNEDYVQAILQNGGIPLIIPFSTNQKVIQEQVSKIDALLLSGGQDIDPVHYKEEPMTKLGKIFPERDQFEFQLIEQSKERSLPILGVCRGHQILNVFHGGTLYQDGSYRKQTTIKHDQIYNPSVVTHSIQICEKSKLYEIFQQTHFRVNSFHHLMIKDLAPHFKAAAKAKDGVIEAIESVQGDFILGVQWHPEMLHESEPSMNKLFQKLIEQAKQKS